MVKYVIEILIALPVFLLWLTVVSILVRPFGIQLPMTPFSWFKRRSAFQALTFPQYLIVGGVLCFGCGTLFLSALSRYLEWRYWHGSAFTSQDLASEIFSSLMAGVLFGSIVGLGRNTPK